MSCLHSLWPASPQAFFAFVGAALLWAGSLVQLNLAISGSRETLTQLLKPLSDLTQEQLNRTLVPRRLLIPVPGRKKRQKEVIASTKKAILTPQDKIDLDRFNREGTGWSLVLMSAVIGVGIAGATAWEYPAAGIALSVVAFVASCVSMLGRHRKDDSR